MDDFFSLLVHFLVEFILVLSIFDTLVKILDIGSVPWEGQRLSSLVARPEGREDAGPSSSRPRIRKRKRSKIEGTLNYLY